MNDKPTLEQEAPANEAVVAKQMRTLLSTDAMQKQLAVVLPKTLTPEAAIRMAITTIQKTPKLQKCTAMSLVGCVMEASQLGFSLDSALGHAYMIAL